MDKIIEKVPQSLFESYLDFLSSLFKNSTVKPAISLAYLTGILPIVRDKIQSKMNEFDEYSMLAPAQFAEFTGFTEEEVQSLCKEYDMDFEGIKGDVITMIGGGKVHVNVFKYMNTFTDFYSKDDVFTYLIHLGYLSYNEDTEECFIPNKEIRAEWINSIEDESDYKEIIEMVNGSRELLERTLQGDEEYVAAALDKAHMRSTNPLTYNNEASFQSAITQIKERKYDDILQHYRGEMLFVGINYDEKSKVHECRIEKL